MKRLAIFLFYDKYGIVDDYVPYFLRKIMEHCDEVCVVVNEPINEDGVKKLKNVSDKLIIRKNYGYDSWAYKEAIEYYGYKQLKSYDELILCNYTFYGPIYPLSEMFNVMDKKECDFWGINRHPEVSGMEFAGVAIVEHIQSHFIVFRKTILQTPDFAEYWATLKPVNNYEEAIAHHELRCTKYFESLGFQSANYIDAQKYFNDYKECNGSIFCAYTQLLEDRSPILKRKVLFIDDNKIMYPCIDGHKNFEVIKLISDMSTYNVDLIYQNLIRTQIIRDKFNSKYKYFICMIIMPWRIKHYAKKIYTFNFDSINLKTIKRIFNK